jgi:hypothetical protein
MIPPTALLVLAFAPTSAAANAPLPGADLLAPFLAQGATPSYPPQVPAPKGTPPPPTKYPEIPRPPRWARGQGALQGFFGVQSFDTLESSGDSIDVEVDGSEMPVIGGGGQWKLAGEKIDFGLEVLFSFGWQANAAAVAVGGGGAAVAVDVDSLVFELYGGPFVNLFLGDSARVYFGAGPMVQWSDWEQDSISDGYDDSGSGFGTGWYARTGIEFKLGPGYWLGFGVRYSDSSVDIGGSVGDVDLEGWQYAITVTTGL